MAELRERMQEALSAYLPPMVTLTGTQERLIIEKVEQAITDAGFAVVSQEYLDMLKELALDDTAPGMGMEMTARDVREFVDARPLQASQEPDCEHVWVKARCEKCGNSRTE